MHHQLSGWNRSDRRGFEPYVCDKTDPVTDVPRRSVDVVESATFDDFYRAEYARIVRLARMLTGTPEAAEDLAQEAFVTLYRHLHRIDNPAAFLRTTTVNLCRNWHRSRRRETARMIRVGPPTPSLSPAAREMDAVLAELPYRQRAVLVLRYWLDLPEAEIAANIGCRRGTVKSLHARALATLRKDI